MAITPMQFLGGVSIAAVPLIASGFLARPTFANAIKSKLDQEEIEKQKKHNFKSDYYTPNSRQDNLIKKYLETGDGKARDYVPNLSN